MGEIVAGETINGILSGQSRANGVKIKGDGHANGNGHGQVNGASTLPPKVAQHAAAGLGIEAHQIQSVLPILAGQKIWLATWSRSKHGHGEGGFSFAYRLAGSSMDKVKDTWRRLRQLQPILRTAFLLGEDGSAAQTFSSLTGSLTIPASPK